jgi:asparagine synthase (glutamine-hydrolysing)
MFLLSRKIKAMGVKMVLSGEGSDEIFGGYLYFHNAPSAAALHEETVRRVKNLHLADCLRANKSTSAWGLEARVPFLDKQFLDLAMNIDPQEKMFVPGERIEKYILRKAFDTEGEPGAKPYLPKNILWRQKGESNYLRGSNNDVMLTSNASQNNSQTESVSPPFIPPASLIPTLTTLTGYGWIDALRDEAKKMVTDEQMANISKDKPHWTENTPTTKEAYWFRSMFDEHFPPQCQGTVEVWAPVWSDTTDPSGRSIKTHDAAYKAGEK